MGKELWRMRSVEKSLNEFEKDPVNQSFTKKWLFFWSWGLQRKITWWLIDSLGDILITLFYRLAGTFFLAMLVFFWVLFLAISF